MDAPNPSSQVTFANRTPLRIGSVGLKARDLSRLTDFYTPGDRAAAASTAMPRPRGSAPAA